MRILLTAMLLCATAQPSHAGECRQTLHPLLLDATPDARALADVRALCQAQADSGDADALYQLALFQLGLAGEWQPDTAIPMIREAAAAGVPEAQYWLAWQSESGALLPRDDALALSWYQRAASANHRLALGRMARAYAAGEMGLHPDSLQAAEYKARQSSCQKIAPGPQT